MRVDRYSPLSKIRLIMRISAIMALEGPMIFTLISSREIFLIIRV